MRDRRRPSASSSPSTRWGANASSRRRPRARSVATARTSASGESNSAMTRSGIGVFPAELPSHLLQLAHRDEGDESQEEEEQEQKESDRAAQERRVHERRAK